MLSLAYLWWNTSQRRTGSSWGMRYPRNLQVKRWTQRSKGWLSCGYIRWDLWQKNYFKLCLQFIGIECRHYNNKWDILLYCNANYESYAVAWAVFNDSGIGERVLAGLCSVARKGGGVSTQHVTFKRQ